MNTPSATPALPPKQPLGATPQHPAATFRLKQFLPTVTVLILIAAGFFIRLRYLQSIQYHPDEFISMLAARAVAEGGSPRLPSGLMYTSELAFSYLAGFLMLTLGVAEFSARWAGLLFGVLQIPLVYKTGQKLFATPYVGLTAAALFAFAPEVALWGARARRYSMIQFLVIAIILLVWLGVIRADRRRVRLLLYGALLWASVAGLLTLMVLPPVALGVLLLAWRTYAPHGWPRKDILLELAAVAAIGLLLLFQIQNDFIAQNPGNWKAGQPEATAAAPAPVTAIVPFLRLDFQLAEGSAFARQVIREQPIYLLVGLPALIVTLLSFLPQARPWLHLRRATWLLAIISGGVALEFTFFVSADWQSSRYVMAVFWPPLALLAASITFYAPWLMQQFRANKPRLPSHTLLWVSTGLSLAVVSLFTLPQISRDFSQNQITNDNSYQVFQFIAHHLHPEDRLATTTTMPAMSFWYLNRSDYYIRLESPYLFKAENGVVSDIWTGARWFHDTESLASVLAEERPLWLVIDDRRLNDQLSLSFVQQILAQMDLRFEAGKIKVFYTKANPRPIPVEPATPLNVKMLDRLEFIGYTLDEAALQAGQSAQLTLFWRMLNPLPVPEGRIFVHLRDSNNQTIIQSDHIPSQEISPLPFDTWRVGEVVPDVSYLTVPATIKPGQYVLMVGVYNPTTMERLPVQNDPTGENAIPLGVITFPLPKETP